MDRQLAYDPITRRVLDWFAQQQIQAWLVGGTLRDLLLGRATHDIDLAVAEGGLRLAQRLANALGAAYFPLDRARDVGRTVWQAADGTATYVDVAALRASTLEGDLRLRDFTLNAMAVDVLDPAGQIIDPTGGQADLQQRRLVAVSERAFVDDPLRILRGVRLAHELAMTMTPATVDLARTNARRLPEVAGERLCAELVRILAQAQAAVAIRELDRLSALAVVLPEIAALQGIAQNPPHYLDVYEHTLRVVDWTQALLGFIRSEPINAGSVWHELGDAAGLVAASLRSALAPLTEPLSGYLLQAVDGEVNRGALLPWIALLHDVGKPATRVVEGGTIAFPGHAESGARLAEIVLRRLHFSSAARRVVVAGCARHETATALARQHDAGPQRRQIYDYFQTTRPAGVEVSLICLADHLATWGPGLQAPRWQARVRTVHTLLDAYFNRYSEVVQPALLLDGRALMAGLDLPPGPRVGELLARLAAAQAAGEVTTQQEAWDLLRGLANLPDRVP